MNLAKTILYATIICTMKHAIRRDIIKYTVHIL